MLTRRSLLAGSAAFAAGCSTLETPLPTPSAPRAAEINVAGFTSYAYLSTSLGGDAFRDDPEDKYRRAAAALAEDKENPYGPARGGYRLALRFFEDFFSPMEELPKSHAEALDAVAGILESLEADLVTVGPEDARSFGRDGLLLPLDRFSGAEEAALAQEFYPSVLNQYRADGVLYALPVGAMPLMLFYDEEFIAQQGVSTPDASWDWDDLVENAVKLTIRRGEDAVAR